MTPKAKGELTLGPKENYLFSFPICYIPTPEQIRNIKEMFGWDTILYDDETTEDSTPSGNY